MLIKAKKGQTKEMSNPHRNFTINSAHIDVLENLTSQDPKVIAAIRRDSDKFKQITDLSAKLAAL